MSKGNIKRELHRIIVKAIVKERVKLGLDKPRPLPNYLAKPRAQ